MIKPITINTKTNYNNVASTKHYKQNSCNNSDLITFQALPKAHQLNPLNYFCHKILRESVTVSRKRIIPPIQELNGIIKTVTLKTVDKKILSCWDINPNNSKKYILFIHGTAQNISHNQELYKALNQNGYGVFALELRGYGKNPKSRFKENKMHLDVDAAIDYIKNKTAINNVNIVAHSLGTAIAIDSAKNYKHLNSVILVAPINGILGASPKTLANSKNIPKPLRTLVKKYPFLISSLSKILQTDRKITQITSPTYIIHSQNDTRIPISVATELSQKAKNLKEFIKLPAGGHQIGNDKIEAIVKILKTANQSN